MPVHRYRSVEDMPPAPPCEPGSPTHIRRLRAFWQRVSELAPRRIEPGVYKYRSVEEQQKALDDSRSARAK